jgi:hypothetical protein
MDEKQREQRMQYVEEAENLAEDPRNEEMSEPRQDYPEEVQDYDQVRKDEDIRDRQPVPVEKELVPLLDESKAQEFRSRWQDIQTEFVDDPQNSVEQADELVTQVINGITENFANERNSLEDQWNRGEQASTEDLRLAMKRYRSFFNRLLTLEASGTAE